MPTLLTPAPALVVAPLCVGVMLLLSLAAGRRMTRLLRVPTGTLAEAERGVAYLAAGVGVLALLPFLLGVAGQLSVATLRVALAALALLLAVDAWAVVSASFRALKGWRPGSPFAVSLLLALAPALLAAFLVALSPSLDPDGLSYHLTVPKRWLVAGQLAYLPTYMYSNTPMSVEMLFTIGLALGGDAAAKLVHFALGCAGALSIYLAGVRLQSKSVGAVAAVLFVAGPTAVSGMLGFAYIEGAITFMMASATLVWLVWLRERDAGWLRLAALLVGYAVSFKITAILFAAVIFALTAVALVDEARKRGQGLPLGLVAQVVALGAAPVLPWFVRSAVMTGNPLFPLFAKTIPTRDLLPETAAMFDHYNRYFLWASRQNIRWSVGFRQLLLLAAAACILAVATLAFLRLRTTLGKATAAVLGAIVLVQLSAVGLYARYWAPVLPLLALPVLAALEGKLLKWQWRWALLGFAALGSLNQVRVGLSSAANDVKGLLLTALGREDYPTFLNRHIVLYPLYDYANQRLPESARIVLSYSCRGFYIDRTTFCTEFPQDALGFSSWSAFMGAVKGLGVTHFMAPKVVAQGSRPDADFSGPSMMYRDRRDQYIGRLLSKNGRMVAEAGDQALYELVDVANVDVANEVSVANTASTANTNE